MVKNSQIEIARLNIFSREDQLIERSKAFTISNDTELR